MRAIATFAVVSAAIIALLAWLLGFAFGSAADARAIRISAGVAYVVQLFAFTIARVMAATNLFAGWGLGMLLRFTALAVYALFVVKAAALPATPALISLAAFFFLTTLVEPVLLKP